ncbi:MAG TPA: TetR/AcrR family transcriptional regulator [Acidimicrobiales bacterium]|nr:TetR/AcrR family transcriptional regulator [Acidimicrobiales bacterium]
MEQRRGRGRPSVGEPMLSTEHLLDAALEAFAERGYDGTSVREIARKLGVSHNLIPQRIGSKEELWRRAVDQGFGRLTLELITALETDPQDDVDRLRAVVAKFIEANARRPSLVRIISKEAVVAGPRFDYLFDNYIDPVRVMGSELLAGLRKAGRLRTDSVALVYFFMTHGAGGAVAYPALAQRFGSNVDPDDPEAVRQHAEEAVELLFGGLVDD